MTDLSPTTQPIPDAFNQFSELTNRRLKIAAVLEALADQVVPANGSRSPAEDPDIEEHCVEDDGHYRTRSTLSARDH